MAIFDSEYLLMMFNRKANQAVASAITPASKYQRLSESQQRIVGMIASVAPYSLYPKVAYDSLPTLTTTDNQCFTFGTDPSGYALFPMGKGGIYPSLSAIPNNPWRPGIDYMLEGTGIRIPNNNTYSGVLYWYGVTSPADITASSQPSLFPEAARELIVIDAVRQFAQEGVRNGALVDEMTSEWNRTWPYYCLVWKSQFRSGGALQYVTGLQLALQGQWAGSPI